MSGICSAHQHHEPGCIRCEARTERVILERTDVANMDFRRVTGEIPVIDKNELFGYLHDSDSDEARDVKPSWYYQDPMHE